MSRATQINSLAAIMNLAKEMEDATKNETNEEFMSRVAEIDKLAAIMNSAEGLEAVTDEDKARIDAANAAANSRYELLDEKAMLYIIARDKLAMILSFDEIPPRVTVYSGPGCFQCAATKKALKTQGTDFIEIDVSIDTDARERLFAAGHRSLPVIEIDGKIAWTGFMPSKISELAAK